MWELSPLFYSAFNLLPVDLMLGNKIFFFQEKAYSLFYFRQESYILRLKNTWNTSHLASLPRFNDEEIVFRQFTRVHKSSSIPIVTDSTKSN